MRLSPLIRTCFRSSRAQPLRTGLLVFGIALGVAGIVAIDIARTSVSKSFELSTAALTARSTHQIQAEDFSVPQSLFARIRTLAGIYKTAPVISQVVGVRELDDQPMTLLGIDAFSDNRFRPFHFQAGTGEESWDTRAMRQVLIRGQGVILSGRLARAHGLAAGDALTLVLGQQTVATRIGALMETGEKMADGLVIADIALAQELLEMGDRISRIDLILDTPEQEKAVRDLLAPGQFLVKTGNRNRTVRGLSRSFETSLTAFSILVLFMGIFLIYNTVSFSVARRRRLNGTFRALGATRADIFLAVLAEVGVFSLVGSVLGLVLGIVLGKGAVQAVCATVSDMYYTLTVSQTHVTAVTLAKGAAVGLGASLASSLAPAVNAARTVPVTLMQSSSAESRLSRFVPSLAWAGLTLIAGALTIFSLKTGRMDLVFAGVFMIFGGASLLAPALIVLLAKGLSRLASGLARTSRFQGGRHYTMAGMGIRNVVRSLSRTSVLIASLMVVISVYIGIDTMTRSFRLSLITWVDGNIGGDIHVSSVDERHPALEPALYHRVLAMDGVAAVSAYNIHRSFSTKSGEIHLFSYVRDLSDKQWTWLDPAAASGNPRQIDDLLNQGWIIVSEIFARQNGLADDANTGGRQVVLDTLEGQKAFRVAGVFRDFFMGGGRAVVSRKDMKRFWGKEEITAMQIFLSSGAAPGGGHKGVGHKDRNKNRNKNTNKNAAIARLMENIRQASEDPGRLRLRSGPEIKNRILGVFDNTFLITTALQFLTALVALTGIINSVMALILERGREMGILRACGAEPDQVRTLVLWECAVAGFMAGLLSLPLGMILSWVLVDVVNYRAFGWTYEIRISGATLGLALGFATVSALAAGLFPAVKAGRVSVAQALRTD